VSNLDLIKQALYFTPLLLQAIIVWRMTVSGSRRNFPRFYAYMLFQAANLVVAQLFLNFGSDAQYFYYWSAQTLVGAALSFLVIYEVFGSVFRPYDALRDFAGVMFRWAALVLVIVALVQALSTPGNESNRLIVGLLIMQRSISVIACGLLLFLLLFSRNLGLDWRHQVFGLALGFGLAYGIELGLITFRILFGCSYETYNLWMILNWNAALSLWTYYMFSPNRVRKTAESFAPKLILERWNQVLRSVNRPIAPQGAFMPNLEKIVDDVMAHRPAGTVH
jgi:hypothetical protein